MTELALAVDAGDELWTLDDLPAAEVPYVTVGDELVEVRSRFPSQIYSLTGQALPPRIRVRRGIAGTTAASHLQGVTLTPNYGLGGGASGVPDPTGAPDGQFVTTADGAYELSEPDQSVNVTGEPDESVDVSRRGTSSGTGPTTVGMYADASAGSGLAQADSVAVAEDGDAVAINSATSGAGNADTSSSTTTDSGTASSGSYAATTTGSANSAIIATRGATQAGFYVEVSGAGVASVLAFGLPTADPNVAGKLYSDGVPSAGVPRAFMVSGG